MSEQQRIRRRHLPHWDVPGAAYFVTACLEGSIPAKGLLDIAAYKKALATRPRPENKSEADWLTEQWKLAFVRTEQWLDQAPAVRHLADPQVAAKVVDAFYFFARERYDLLAFVVMPSHFHWVFQPLENWIAKLQPDRNKRSARERIMHSIKSYTANQGNKHLSLQGRFWQQESYDHWVRDVDELERIIHYVENNPLQPGLAAAPASWPFSSAHDRAVLDLPLGMPLLRRPAYIRL